MSRPRQRELAMPDTAVAAPPPQAAQPGGGAGGGSGIGQLLRDPEHYEEISVIGNGEWGMAAQVLLLSNLCCGYF